MGTELKYLLEGVPSTLFVAIGSWLLCLSLGLLLAALTQLRARVVRWPASFVTIVVRGCPELVVLFVLFFGLQRYLSLSPRVAAVLAFGVVGAPFACEVYRAALKTVNVGQRDAGLSVGLNRVQLAFRVIFPQAVLFAIPPLFNLLVGMLNVSAVAGAIGVDDIFNHEQTLLNESTDTNVYFRATLLVCGIYVALVLPLRWVSALIERRIAGLMAPVAAIRGSSEARRSSLWSRPISWASPPTDPTSRPR